MSKSLMSKSLDLKITVVCSDADPDAVLARMDKRYLRLAASPYTLKITKIERADGQPVGLEAEFEEYWQEYNQGREEENPYGYEKSSARDAFMYAVKLKSQQ